MANHTSMRTSVDGVRAGGKRCYPGVSGKRDGVRTESAHVYHPFQFAPLQTTGASPPVLFMRDLRLRLTRSSIPLSLGHTSASVSMRIPFMHMSCTDDEDALCGVGAPEQLGTIELRVVHIHPHVRSAPFKPATFAGVSRVHERSKKAGAHCVTYVSLPSVPHPSLFPPFPAWSPPAPSV